MRDVRHVHVPKIGPVRTAERVTALVRLLERDPQARILRGSFNRDARGRWFCSFTVERSPKARRPRRPGAAVGVDLGLRRLATVSDGSSVPNPKPLAGALGRLRLLQRSLDRRRRAANPGNHEADGQVRRLSKGQRHVWVESRGMAVRRRQIARLHGRIADLRREAAHQLTTALTREFGVIGVESLAVKNLMRNRRLARHIGDAGWGRILAQLKYKTGWSGGLVVAADRFYPSSKTCSGCGTVKAKLSLSERVFACGACGLELDRDHNAAINLGQIAANAARDEGITCTTACTGRAGGGPVSPGPRPGAACRSEQAAASSRPSQAGNSLALA